MFRKQTSLKLCGSGNGGQVDVIILLLEGKKKKKTLNARKKKKEVSFLWPSCESEIRTVEKTVIQPSETDVLVPASLGKKPFFHGKKRCYMYSLFKVG